MSYRNDAALRSGESEPTERISDEAFLALVGPRPALIESISAKLKQMVFPRWSAVGRI